MSSTRRSYVSVFFAALSFVLASSITAFAQQTDIKIKNFGQMDDRFYRGAQPKEEDYKQLAAIGIKTIIDLREDPTEYEKREAEAAGIHYVNIPMSDKDYPPTSKIDQFLKLVDDPSTGKFFVHCAGGRHRTGVMGAVYRFNHYNWNFEQVYAEMKKYDFYTRWGHGDMKKFVQDYSNTFHTRNATAAAAATVTTTINQK
ncbi:MAG TPA: tyrosine-protein phosphatase [Pyrinomonadaceae bacterium]|nr:tyrosine-protein phosphatase [Pyrinomonadaceae bacterium]